MDEIEVKIFNINRKEVEKKIIALGAKKVFDGRMLAVVFDYPDFSLKKRKISIRVRQEGKRCFMTLKRPSKKEFSGVKTKDEYQIEISSFVVARKLLESLGLRAWLLLDKRRTSYCLEDTRFEFDRYCGKHKFIPEFMEIEAKDAKTVFRYAKLLGFSKEDCKPWSIFKLIEEFKK